VSIGKNINSALPLRPSRIRIAMPEGTLDYLLVVHVRAAA
jgi:hypothetical protein